MIEEFLKLMDSQKWQLVANQLLFLKSTTKMRCTGGRKLGADIRVIVQMIFTTKTILILLIIQMIALLAYNFSGMCVTGSAFSINCLLFIAYSGPESAFRQFFWTDVIYLFVPEPFHGLQLAETMFAHKP